MGSKSCFIDMPVAVRRNLSRRRIRNLYQLARLKRDKVRKFGRSFTPEVLHRLDNKMEELGLYFGMQLPHIENAKELNKTVPISKRQLAELSNCLFLGLVDQMRNQVSVFMAKGVDNFGLGLDEQLLFNQSSNVDTKKKLWARILVHDMQRHPCARVYRLMAKLMPEHLEHLLRYVVGQAVIVHGSRKPEHV